MAAEIKNRRRKDIPEYPIDAIQEALFNALIHSDYSLHGMRIMVAIFSDRLEIQNPGLLPFGMTLENFKSGVSRVRNHVIARVFAELGLVEQWGTGYKRILEVCKKEGYPEPKWEEIGSVIRVTFYPHPQTQALGADLVLNRHQVGTKSESSPEELQLIEFCNTQHSITEIMQVLGWKDRTKFRNKYIKPLLTRGLLAMTFPDKPNSSKQKYFTTELGLVLLKQINS